MKVPGDMGQLRDSGGVEGGEGSSVPGFGVVVECVGVAMGLGGCDGAPGGHGVGRSPQADPCGICSAGCGSCWLLRTHCWDVV